MRGLARRLVGGGLLLGQIVREPAFSLSAIAKAVTPGATVVLAGLLDSQADAVIAAYEAEGMSVVERGDGEWCVLVLEASA